MSEEDVEFVRPAYAAINRGDIGQALARCHPRMHYASATMAVEGKAGVVSGPEGLRKWFDEFRQSWSVSMELKEVSEVRTDCILAVIDWEGVGVGSEAPVTAEYAAPLFFDDGMLVRLEGHASRKHALRRHPPLHRKGQRHRDSGACRDRGEVPKRAHDRAQGLRRQGPSARGRGANGVGRSRPGREQGSLGLAPEPGSRRS